MQDNEHNISATGEF